jgi:hypothetical protein
MASQPIDIGGSKDPAEATHCTVNTASTEAQELRETGVHGLCSLMERNDMRISVNPATIEAQELRETGMRPTCTTGPRKKDVQEITGYESLRDDPASEDIARQTMTPITIVAREHFGAKRADQDLSSHALQFPVSQTAWGSMRSCDKQEVHRRLCA